MKHINKKPYLSPSMEIWQTEPVHLLTVSHRDDEEKELPYTGDGEDDDDGEGSTTDSF